MLKVGGLHGRAVLRRYLTVALQQASTLALVKGNASLAHPGFPKSRVALPRTVMASLIGGAMMFGVAASAQTVNWTGATDNNWSTGSNWSPAGAPNAAGISVTFIDDDANLNGKTITLSGTNTVGNLLVGAINNTTLRSFTLSGGTLNFNNNGAQSQISLSGNRAVTINSAITTANDLLVSNASAFGGTLTLGGTLNGGGHVLTLDAAVNTALVMNGVISNTSSVTKTGVGTLRLNAVNTFAGSFNFTAGTVAIGNNAAFGTSAIVLANGGGQTFDTAGAARTVANAVTLNDGFNVAGGSSLTFSASQTSTLTGTLSLNTANITTLDFGANFALQGTGGITKSGFGSLTLESQNNTFSGGLNVQQGTVNTGSFTNTLVVGAATGTNHMLGTGNITMADSSAILNINGTAASTTQFAGGVITISNGATVNVLNGATVNFAGGTIDFGTGAQKGNLNFTGALILGNTTFLNAGGSTMTVGGNVTFSAGSTIAASGTNFILNGVTAQTVNGAGAVSIAGSFTKQGAGTATLASNITSFTVGSLSTLGGTLNLGAASIGTPTVNAGGGTLVFGAVNQFGAGATVITLLAGTNSVFNLTGFDQTFAGISSGAAAQATFNLGGTSSVANTLTLGSLSGTLGTLRIGGWDGTTASAFDHVIVTGAPDAQTLASIWFQGFQQGATATAIGGGQYELTPVANISSEWNGLATDLLWSTGGNWVGGDTYNVPNRAGATAIFGNLAGDLGGRTISLGSQTWTLGNLTLNTTLGTAGSVLGITGGTLAFNSGQTGVAAQLNDTSGTVGLSISASIVLNSDLILNSSITSHLTRISGAISGSGEIVKNGPGQLLLYNNNSFTGGVTLNSGAITLSRTGPSSILGTGTLTLNQGTLTGTVSGISGLSNQLVFGSNSSLTVNYIDFIYNGDVALNDATSILTTSSALSGYMAGTTFNTGLSLVGSGSLLLNGSGTRAMLSSGNTFSGGLRVNAGGLLTNLTSGLILGAFADGNNYFGSGDVTVDGSGVYASVASNGQSGALTGSTLSVQNGGQFRYLGGGAFTLSGGTLSGGTGSTKGTLRVSGDLTFDGTSMINLPGIIVDTATSLTGSTTVFGNGIVTGIGGFYKYGAGVTTLDASITSLAASNVYLNGGALLFGADDQIANSSGIVLNGGALGANNYHAALGTVYLRANSSLLLGDTGGLTFSSRQTSAANWVDDTLLVIQNTGGAWIADPSSTYVRFSSDPNFTAAQLANIAFTGYEAGALVSTSGGFWYLLPNAVTTNEWSGGANPDNNWGTAGNWSVGAAPNGAGASASIRDADANLDGKTIVVDGNYTVGHLNIQSGSGQSFTLGGSGTLIIDGGAGTAQILQTGASTVTIAANTVLNGSTSLNMSVAETIGFLNWTGAVSGAGGFVKTGSGKLNFSGGSTNSYTGGFLWQDASLIQVNANGSLFGSGMFTIGDGTDKTYRIETINGASANTGSHTISTSYTLAGNLTLQKDTINGVTTSDAIGTANILTFNGSGTLASGTNVLNVYGNTSNFTSITEKLSLALMGTLDGAGGIRKTGYGDLYLSGSGNSFSGGFTLVGGRVYVSHDQAFGTGILTFSATSPYNASIEGTTGSASNPLVFNNQLTVNSNYFFYGGYLKFDYSGTSTLVSGTFNIGTTTSTSLLIFGKNHILDGSGGIRTGVVNSWYNYGTIRFEGANTFTGGFVTQTGTIQVGVDSAKDGSGAVISGALGMGTVTFVGGTISAYSDSGSGIVSRRLSNAINLSSNALSVGAGGDATTLIFDTPTIALRDGKLDWTLTTNTGATLLIESRLIDNGSLVGGITKAGAGTLQLVNGSNQISDGIRVTAGTVRATATGDVVTGRLDAGHNYLGTGQLVLDGGLTQIATADGSNVYLSGLGMTMNNAANLTVSGGTGIRTYFDSNSSFTGTSTTGTITTSGQLIKSGAGTVTSVGAKLVTPELVLQQDATLSLTNANLVAGVGKLTLNGGTLAVNGLSQTFGASTTLVLTADSHIDMGAGASVVTVGNLQISGNYVGNSGLTLNVDNWSGQTGSGGGADRFIVLNGLSAGQRLYNVWFTGGYSSGVQVVLNPYNQLELVPLGVAFTWNNAAGSNLWNASNWYDPSSSGGTPNGSGATAVFGDLTASLNGATVSLGTGATVGAISFESTQGQSFTLAGSSPLTLNTGDPLQPSQIRVTGNSSPVITVAMNLLNDLTVSVGDTGTLTLNNAIAGPNTGITKSGNGTLIFGANSTSSNYTGGLTIHSGTVEIGASSSLDGLGGVASGPAGIGLFTIDGGTLQATGAARTLHNGVVIGGSFTVAGANGLTLAGSTGATGDIAADAVITVADAAGSLTFGPNLPLTGTGNLTVSGLGTVNFNSNGTGYSGDIAVTSGIVGIGANSGFGTGTVTLAGGTMLTANAAGLSVGNVLALSGGTVTVATGTNSLTLTGAISGSGSLDKTGTGMLTLGGASSYSGGTDVSAGTVMLTHAQGAGTGDIAIAGGAALTLGFSNGTLANDLSGTGTTTVTGTNVALGGDNTGFTGTLSIGSGASASVEAAINLGGSGVVLGGTGQLTINPASGDFLFGNALSGTGTLGVALGAATDVFSFGSGAANGFTGTVQAGLGTIAIDNNASGALSGATLSLNTGSTGIVTGDQSIGNVILNGGTLNPLINPGTGKLAGVTSGTLALNSGTIVIDLAAMGTPSGLLVADDGVTNQLISAPVVTGSLASVTVVDSNGNVIPQIGTNIQDVVQHGATVARATYSTSLSLITSGPDSGLQNSYQLTQLSLQSGQTLTLTESVGATGSAAQLSALVTGTGNLDIAANNAITISNAANGYTGTTTVSSGTALAGAANVFQTSTAMIVVSGATLDLNGFANQVNNLQGSGTVIASAALTANNTGSSAFSGVISGAGSLTKTGTGTLTLSGVSTYGGATAVNGGTLILTDAGAVSTGTVTVASGAVLELGFSNVSFGNVIAGAGTVDVSGVQVALTGLNTLGGQWDITGSAVVMQAANLGTAGVRLDGASSALAVTPASGSFTFANALSGSGTLSVALASGTDSFAFGSGAGNAFAGTMQMGQGQFALSGTNTAALTDAGLVVNTGATVTVGTGTQAIGRLVLSAGTMVFDATVPAQQTSSSLVSASSLDAGGTTTIRITLPGAPGTPSVPVGGNSVNLLAQDDTGALTQLVSVAAGSATGGGGTLVLVDQNDQPVSTGQTIAISSGGVTVATGTYDYRLNTGTDNDGLYVAYALKSVDLLSGQTLTLTPDAGASASTRDLSAQLTGTGNLEIAAGAGQAVSLTNTGNSYTGTTSVTSGTLVLGSDNALGTGASHTSSLILSSGASADVNGHAQTIGGLTGATGSILALNGGSLTITTGGTSSGSLTGAGTLSLAGGALAVSGANSGLTAAVTIASGASSTLDNVAGFGTGGTVTADGTLTFDTASGTLSKAIAGSGTVALTNGSAVILTGNNSLSGNWNTVSGTSLTASAAANLGTAAIDNAGSFTVNSGTDWTLSNTFTGAGSFTKTGTGDLTIATANGRTGTTTISGGTLTLEDTGGVGTGSIAVGTAAGSATTGLNLAFASDAAFTNTLSGSGTTRISGAGTATVSGANGAYAGTWQITGSAAIDGSSVSSLDNLGTGTVNIGATGVLNAVTGGNFSFDNALTGTGRVNVATGGNSFTIGSGAGTNFAGTVALGDTLFSLSGQNTAALTNANLEVGIGSVVAVGLGNQAMAGLTLRGGELDFADVHIPGDLTPGDTISVSTLDLGTTALPNRTVIALDPAAAGLINPSAPTDRNLLDQDGEVLLQLVSAGTVTGSTGNLALQDLGTGTEVSHPYQVGVSEGGNLVANATYDYIFTTGTGNDGLYVSYGLQQLALQAGQTLTLTPDVGATGSALEMAAIISGSGNLGINAGAGVTVSLSNVNNSYTGATYAESGTLRLMADGVLGQTSTLDIWANASVDLNGMNQTVGVLNTAAGSALTFNGGTLTVSDAQRAGGVTDGGSIEANTVFGGGSFVIDPSIVHVNGAQTGYTGLVTVTGGSELVVNTANVFDNAQGIVLATASDTLTFGDESGYNPAWTSIANGSAAVSISGAGLVQIQDGSDVNLTGDNNAFSGRFVAAVNSALRASEQRNLGTAGVQVDGTLNLIANSIWELGNTVTGAGTVLKTGSGILSVDQALSGFAGLTDVQSGVLVVGEGTAGALVGGDMTVEAGAMLSGTGTVAGAVYNAGTIVAYNALPGLTGYGDASQTSNLTVGPLSNAGVVMLAGGQVGNTLTVTGGLTGLGGKVVLNTVFGNDTSKTDRLILDGGSTGGSTSLVIYNQGGAGAQTSTGIQVVQAAHGATTAADSFVLDPMSSGFRSTTSTLAIGAYDYSLVRGGNGGEADSWYLTSADNGTGGSGNVIRPEAGVYGANAAVSRTMFVTTLKDREGYRQQTASGDLPYAGWGRISGSRETGRAASNALSTSAGTVKAQLGLDLFKWESAKYGSFYAGIMGGWGHSETDARSRQASLAKASGTVDGYSVGAYGTWYEKDRGLGGAYVDSWAQYSWFNNEVRGGGLPQEKYDAHSFTASVEAGYGFLLMNGERTKLFLEPQVQLAYVNYVADRHVETGGTTVRYKDGSGFLARFGARLHGVMTLESGQVLRPYIEANYWYNQKGGKVSMNNDLVPGGSPRSFGEIKAGLSGDIGKNLQLWGDVGVQVGGNRYTAFTAQAGFKYSW